MSTFDQASLVMIPSGYKTSKVYSIKPTDGSGDMSFSRSNDTATRVNSAGLIEKVRTNLATYSEQLNNSSGWGFEQLAVTANAVANPLDGAVTADKIYATVTGSSVPILKQYTAATANQTITVSGYFKKAEYDYVVIHGFGLGGTVFNLAAGTKSGAGTITSVGNGWYRCAAVLAMSGDARIFITPSVDGNVGYTSTANSGVYAFGMQFELGDIATDYIPTTSAAVSVGPVANVPRLDYLNSSCPRLLLEPQRTNLATQSSAFNSAAWFAQNGISVTANTVASPDGTTNADTLEKTGGSGGTNYYYVVRSITSNTINTFSVFAKYKTGSGIIWLLGKNSGYFAYFNLQTGTALSASAGMTTKIENYGNGWYRCSFTQDYTGASNYTLGVGVCLVNGTPNYNADTAATQGVYLYGAQFEAGAYATSYIPTLGAAVTRGADACSKTGISSLIGQTEGTLFADITIPTMANVGANLVSISLFNAGLTNLTLFDIYDSGNLLGTCVNGTVQALITKSGFTAGRHKVAFGYKANDFVLYVDGVLVGTDTSGTVGAQDSFGLQYGTSQFIGQQYISQALVFKTRLTNAQLAELTTL